MNRLTQSLAICSTLLLAQLLLLPACADKDAEHKDVRTYTTGETATSNSDPDSEDAGTETKADAKKGTDQKDPEPDPYLTEEEREAKIWSSPDDPAQVNATCSAEPIKNTYAGKAREGNNEAPKVLVESWHGHGSSLALVYEDDDVVVYFASDVKNKDKVLKWLPDFLKQSWNHTRNRYGSFGNGRLFAAFHGVNIGGCMGTYIDGHAKNRNMIDVGLTTLDDETNMANRHYILHEMSHIVESVAFGAVTSPSASVWGDSMFAEIYIYSMLKYMGCDSFAARTIKSFPSGWFTQFYKPTLDASGGSKYLSRYFALLNAYFPKTNNIYTRRMTREEFVLFNSAAAGKDLTAAAKGIGWTAANDAAYVTTKNTFAKMKITSRRDSLENGEALVVNQELKSKNGKHRLILREDGILALYNEDVLAWSQGKAASGATFLRLEETGDLNLYGAKNQILYSNNAADGLKRAYSLKLGDDGILALYREDETDPYWTSEEKAVKYGDRLAAGVKLSVGEKLISKNGRYRLILQSDGNLVIYLDAVRSLWSNKKVGSDSAYIKIKSDGNLVAINSKGEEVWETGTAGSNRADSFLLMQDDGNLVLYTKDNKAIWASNTKQ